MFVILGGPVSPGVRRKGFAVVVCLFMLALAIPFGPVLFADEAPKAEPKKVDDVAALKAQLNEALRKGDDAEVERLFDALERAQRGLPNQPEVKPAPKPEVKPVPTREPDKVEAPKPLDLGEQFQKQLREFDEMMKRIENDDDRKQLENNRDGARRAMEQNMQNIEMLRRLMQQNQRNALPVNPADLFRGFPGFPQLDGFPNDPFGRDGDQPRLGVGIEKIAPVLIEQLNLPQNAGLVVTAIQPNSPAEKAGLKTNDIILQLGGKDVPADPTQFQEMVRNWKAGEKIEAVVMRKGKKETIKGIEFPEAAPNGRRGINGIGGIGGAGGFNRSIQFSTNGDEATMKSKQGDIEYTIRGSMKRGKISPNQIIIREGDKTVIVESLDKVPEQHQDAVQRLINQGSLKLGR